jgi:hypothetical protein
MMDRDVLDGDLAIFQRYDFGYLQNGKDGYLLDSGDPKM